MRTQHLPMTVIDHGYAVKTLFRFQAHRCDFENDFGFPLDVANLRIIILKHAIVRIQMSQDTLIGGMCRPVRIATEPTTNITVSS